MTASTNVALPSVEEMAALHGRGVGNAERLSATAQTKGSLRQLAALRPIDFGSAQKAS